MTAQPLAPVIPSSALPSSRHRVRAAGGRPLPLARPVPIPPVPEGVVYGIGRMDSSGRIADRTITSALGWRGGDRLTLTAKAGVVTARRDPGGMVTLQDRLYIAIPATLRRRCAFGPATGCCSPPSRARTPSPPTASPSCTKPSAPTTRSRTRKENSHDHP